MQSIIVACSLNRTAKACAVDFLKMEEYADLLAFAFSFSDQY